MKYNGVSHPEGAYFADEVSIFHERSECISVPLNTDNIMSLKKLFKKYSSEIVLGTLFLLAYLPSILWMWDRWFAPDSYYSHGILIPFVSGYLVWQKRAVLRSMESKSSAWGLALIVTGLLVHLISSVLRIYFSSVFSMLLVLVGLIAHFYGTRVLRELVFPVSFLIFMLPMPLVVIVNISFKMKLFAAEIARNILTHMGLFAVREGSIIRMQHTYVVVEDVCSGLRSLIALAALGSIFAYGFKRPMHKRIFLFLSTIPIAVITNVCRIVFLAAVSEIWGARYATGLLHDASGFFVFALAFLMLFAIAKIIE